MTFKSICNTLRMKSKFHTLQLRDMATLSKKDFALMTIGMFVDQKINHLLAVFSIYTTIIDWFISLISVIIAPISLVLMLPMTFIFYLIIQRQYKKIEFTPDRNIFYSNTVIRFVSHTKFKTSRLSYTNEPYPEVLPL